jgi:predicted esterase
MTDQTNPHVHQNQPVLAAGAALDAAQTAVILLHGRGSSAQNILGLAAQLPRDATAYLAPQATGHTWYPQSGFLPLEANQPYIESAFQVLDDLFARVTDAGIDAQHIVLGGFSQGACLAAEYVARHPQRYGGLLVLSGALLGPPDMARSYDGSLDGTPVYVGGCERDPWVTEQQLRLTGRELDSLGAAVTVEVQPGSDHTIRAVDLEHAQRIVTGARP